MKNTRVAEIELSYNPKIKAKKWPKVTSSEIAHELFYPKFEKDMNFKESSMMLLLNRAHKVKGIVSISAGGLSGTTMDMAIIFGTAVKALASAIILCHNHPSGNLTPSKTDIKTTEKLVAAGNILDIEVLDHLIISEEGYTSLADEGLI